MESEEDDKIDHSQYASLDGNELFEKWKANRDSLPSNFDRLLDPDLEETARGDLFEAEDELAMERYSWAIPDQRALSIIEYFAPIVEMGAGAGYWARLLREKNVSISCFDKNTGKSTQAAGVPAKPFTKVENGGPNVLAGFPNATLLLIYPDDCHEDNEMTLSLESLKNYRGETIIHVGEWFGITLSLTMEGQGTSDVPYPWGRSTSPDFQILLEASFHKILSYELPNWGSVRNCLTVWKRSASSILDGDRYAYIPESEKLKLNLSSPCTRHLLE